MHQLAVCGPENVMVPAKDVQLHGEEDGWEETGRLKASLLI